MLGEETGGTLASLLEPPGEERHEGRVEGALGKQAAEEIGQALGDEEGIGHLARAQDARDQHVADKAQHPARHGVAADRGDRANHRHGGSVYRIAAELGSGRKPWMPGLSLRPPWA